MNSDIESFHFQLLSIVQDAPGIADGLTDAQFYWRPDPGRWSVGDCFAHMNKVTEVFLPVIDRAIARARAEGLTSPGPFVYSMIERIVLRFTEPPPRIRTPAPKSLRPQAEPNKPAATVIREFQDFQAAIDERILRADGLDLKRARERSPALPIIKWSLGTLLAISWRMSGGISGRPAMSGTISDFRQDRRDDIPAIPRQCTTA